MAITYNALYFAFTFGFTYFYTAITFDVNDVADNLKRYSSFIPGIRPGTPDGGLPGRGDEPRDVRRRDLPGLHHRDPADRDGQDLRHHHINRCTSEAPRS